MSTLLLAVDPSSTRSGVAYGDPEHDRPEVCFGVDRLKSVPDDRIGQSGWERALHQSRELAGLITTLKLRDANQHVLAVEVPAVLHADLATARPHSQQLLGVVAGGAATAAMLLGFEVYPWDARAVRDGLWSWDTMPKEVVVERLRSIYGIEPPPMPRGGVDHDAADAIALWLIVAHYLRQGIVPICPLYNGR